MNPRFLAALAILVATPASAQLLEGGARSIALGRAGVALGDDVWAEANPAAWATLAGRRAEAFASQAFGLTELRTAAVAAAMPSGLAGFAVVLRTYGFADYRENRLSVGAARAVRLDAARRLTVGMRLDYHATATVGFESAATGDLSLGVQTELAPALRAGLAARNVVGMARADSSDLRAPLSSGPAVLAGVAYRPSARSLLLLAVDKDLDYPIVARAGVEFAPVDALALRLGASAAARGVPARLSFGAGVRVGAAAADVAVEWHETLGPSTAIGVGLRF